MGMTLLHEALVEEREWAMTSIWENKMGDIVKTIQENLERGLIQILSDDLKSQEESNLLPNYETIAETHDHAYISGDYTKIVENFASYYHNELIGKKQVVVDKFVA